MVHEWSHNGVINGLIIAYKWLWMVHKWLHNGIMMVYKGLWVDHNWSHNGLIMVYTWSMTGFIMVTKVYKWLYMVHEWYCRRHKTHQHLSQMLICWYRLALALLAPVRLKTHPDPPTLNETPRSRMLAPHFVNVASSSNSRSPENSQEKCLKNL